MGCLDILGELSLNAIALTTPVYQTLLCRPTLTVLHAHVHVVQTCILRLRFSLQCR
jgi:hypothetical protein